MVRQHTTEVSEVERDAKLVRKVLKGDEAAAARLFRRHAEAVYAFALPRTGRDVAAAEDVTQETFLDAWRNLESFDPKRSFPGWLVGIARRKLARHHRKLSRSRESGDGRVLDWLEGRVLEPGALIESRETALAVTDALAQLPAGTRSLLLGKYRDGKSLEEIGGELGIRAAAVSSRLQRAREALRRALNGTGGRDALAG